MSILAAQIPGARVADLFSGSGIIGYEVLSRGAASVDFFESGHVPAKIIESNGALLGVAAQITLHRRPLPGGVSTGAPWDLVFVDPPWGKNLGGPAAEAVLGAGRLSPEARLVMRERVGQQDDETLWMDRGYELLDERVYGESAVQFLVPLPSQADPR
jgi:16S rRNA (guanine966-N2)-methyltransferase